MNYIAITEIIPVYTTFDYESVNKMTGQQIMEEFDKAMKNCSCSFVPINPDPPLKNYMIIRLSEETFNFINSVAIVSSPLFGEKEYKINNITFRIFTEGDYEQKYGKLEKEEVVQSPIDRDFDISVKKSHLMELYNFAYRQALKTGDMKELHKIDLKINDSK